MGTRRNLAHFVPLWTRWSPAFAKAREIVRSGGIGEVKVVNYRWHNPRPAQMALTVESGTPFTIH